MRAFAIVAMLAFSTTAAQAQYFMKVAATGQKIRLDFAHSLNPDCTPSGKVTIRLIKDADHGRVVSPPAHEFPRIAKSSTRSVCNARRVHGNMVSYISERGFVGTDYVTVEYYFPSGTMARRNYTIQVR